MLSRERSMLLELAYNSKEKGLHLTGKGIKGQQDKMARTMGRIGSKAFLVEEIKKESKVENA